MLCAVYARCSDCENRLRVREFWKRDCVVSVEGKVREMGDVMCDFLEPFFLLPTTPPP